LLPFFLARFGQFLGVNSHSETWQVDVSAEDLIGALVEVLEGLTEKQKRLLLMPNLEIAEKSANKLRVRTWTKLEWLDVFEMSCVDTDDGCVAKVSARTPKGRVREKNPPSPVACASACASTRVSLT